MIRFVCIATILALAVMVAPAIVFAIAFIALWRCHR